MLQDTDIQTSASDIQQTAEMILAGLTELLEENPDWTDEKAEKELDAIANKLWKLKTKLLGEN